MDGEEGPPYQLRTEDGEVRPFSMGFTGRGFATYPNSDTYDGVYADGAREGRGCYTYWAKGEKYDGEWK